MSFCTFRSSTPTISHIQDVPWLCDAKEMYLNYPLKYVFTNFDNTSVPNASKVLLLHVA